MPKPKVQSSAQEFEASKWNNKAMHSLLCAMDKNQYKLIKITRNAYEAWEILETAHEETQTVNNSKLQALQTQFKTIKMEEDECFYDFQIKLRTLSTKAINLGILTLT